MKKTTKADVWHVDAVGAALRDVKSVDEVRSYAQDFVASCHLEVFLLGNVARAPASDLARALRAAASAAAAAAAGGAAAPAPLAAAARPADRCVRLPVGAALVHRQAAKNPEEENCCVELYLQVAPASDVRARALLDLVDQIMFEPCYDALRTKQQVMKGGELLAAGDADADPPVNPPLSQTPSL